MNHHALLKLSAINSVASYLLPEVFRNLSHGLDKIQICFRHCHFSEAYDYVADGIVDLALISNTRYYPNLETIPLFQEPMVLLTNKRCLSQYCLSRIFESLQ
ncbi:LysR family transcriptional regulator substrate-binding protein [Anaerostipes sp. MSJ-23]|uniref:LysR family transcriptional regulator substrate-binding protein n=1 Tax=Anaerostipes sp. MSJ-23 TaxID=2841520 RepID=UPI001C11BD7D|nr:LysR family transcriptional regulator substrate-binding protein [Anaerostipes sp. MSJ-23]MBU5461074.1 LysR family transcriptional regulator substrate-binding protein [Anaerostipes sp. MSJ-23]